MRSRRANIASMAINKWFSPNPQKLVALNAVVAGDRNARAK